MRLVWLALTRRMDPTHFSVGDTVPGGTILEWSRIDETTWWGGSGLRKMVQLAAEAYSRAAANSRNLQRQPRRRSDQWGGIS